MITNLNYLQGMAGGNKAVINEMIDIFIEQVIEVTEELEQALANNDYLSLSQLAHKAKASVSIMGMDELAQDLKKLELSAQKAIEKESYPIIVKKFKDQCQQAISELNAVKNE